VRNLLKHAGILDGPVEASRSVELAMPSSDCFLFSLSEGLVQPAVDLGERVREGDVLARIYPVAALGKASRRIPGSPGRNSRRPPLSGPDRDGRLPRRGRGYGVTARRSARLLRSLLQHSDAGLEVLRVGQNGAHCSADDVGRPRTSVSSRSMR
jgi:hypothetical protein